MTGALVSGWLLDADIQTLVFGEPLGEAQPHPIGALKGDPYDVPGLASTGDAPAIPLPALSDDARTRLARLDAAVPPQTRGDTVVHGVGKTSNGADWSLSSAEPALPMLRAVLAEFLAQHIAPEAAPSALLGARLRAWSYALPQTASPRDLPDPARCAFQQEHHAHYGFFATKVSDFSFPRFDGGMSGTIRREVFHTPHAALVLPYDPVRDEVVLIEQFRLPPTASGISPWVLEPAAGLIDPGETPEETARRECLEEARLELKELLPLPPSMPSPGNMTSIFYPFVALCDLSDYTPQIAGLASESEDIRSSVFAFDQAMQMLRDGHINVTPLVVLLLWLAQERASLRSAG